MYMYQHKCYYLILRRIDNVGNDTKMVNGLDRRASEIHYVYGA